MITAQELRCEYQKEPLGIATATPRFSWTVSSPQLAYQVQVFSRAIELWDSGRTSANGSECLYRGKQLASGQRYTWRVRVWDKQGRVSRWSSQSWFELALLTESDWEGARWIDDGKPILSTDKAFFLDDPAPRFEHKFVCNKPVLHARLSITGLGYAEPSLNGKKIGDDWLSPGWTTVKKTVLFSTFDLSAQLKLGENVLSVLVGNGFYNPLPLKMWGHLNLREQLTVGRPRLIACLKITHTDGSQSTVVSGPDWTVRDSPIVKNSVYLGEHYDARQELVITPTRPVRLATDWLGSLVAQSAPPIRVTKTLSPRRITEPKPGVFIVDFGQNFAGVTQISVEGPAGTEIKLRSGELLNADGTLNPMTAVAGQIKNAAAASYGAPVPAAQVDQYICHGNGKETWHPRFTFHGFRYVEITGWPGKPRRENFKGLRLSAAVEPIGHFECANPKLNQLDTVCQWTFLSNLFSVQSDCPHREKFGYGGDIVPTADAFLLHYDMANFYAKVVQDFADAARENGGTTETAPFVGIDDAGPGGGAGPLGWMVAFPVLLDRLYRYYGNTQLIAQHFDRVAKLVEFTDRKADNHIVSFCLGDHESLDPKPVAILATALHLHQTRLLAEFARILGKQSDAQKYDQLATTIAAAFVKAFLKSGTGVFDSGSQACQAAAFAFDLVPMNERDAALKRLVASVERDHQGHIATGIFGTRWLLDQLTQLGKHELAYSITTQEGFPGWLHMLNSGATTLWETWKVSDNTYSNNHPMFGSVSAWLIESVAGLRPAPDAVGFDKIVFRPGVVRSLAWAKASYRSVRGQVAISWKHDGRTVSITTTVPAGARATLIVPGKQIPLVPGTTTTTVALSEFITS